MKLWFSSLSFSSKPNFTFIQLRMDFIILKYEQMTSDLLLFQNKAIKSRVCAQIRNKSGRRN